MKKQQKTNKAKQYNPERNKTDQLTSNTKPLSLQACYTLKHYYHGKLSSAGSNRSGCCKPCEHDHIIGSKGSSSPEELRAAGWAREDDRKLVGEVEINGPGELASDKGAVGLLGGGSEESSGLGRELQGQELFVHACHGVERSVSVPPSPGWDRSLP